MIQNITTDADLLHTGYKSVVAKEQLTSEDKIKNTKIN
jgi:hypothetical protein